VYVVHVFRYKAWIILNADKWSVLIRFFVLVPPAYQLELSCISIYLPSLLNMSICNDLSFHQVTKKALLKLGTLLTLEGRSSRSF
jgi:hypothetical protein